jgi:hypothetical protein
LFCVPKKITPQEKACLAVMRVCIFIIMDIIAWELDITWLEALIFISLHPQDWADYTMDKSEKMVEMRISKNYPPPTNRGGCLGRTGSLLW